MAIVRYHFPVEKVRNVLSGRKWYGFEYLFAALLGMITPFCSCSSIPLFIGFVSAGIPLGVTFAFLISSPLINESSLYLFPAMFGIKTTIIYNLLGITIAVAGGIIMQKLKLEKYLKMELLKFKSSRNLEIEKEKNFWNDGMEITKSIFPYVVLGVAIGAAIHGFVPASLVEKYLSVRSWYAVPLATILGAPIYANSVSVIPIMEALINKGVPLGTALSFMTAIVTLSIPEALILKKVMKWQLLTIFMGITTVGIIVIGYVFNYML